MLWGAGVFPAMELEVLREPNPIGLRVSRFCYLSE